MCLKTALGVLNETKVCISLSLDAGDGRPSGGGSGIVPTTQEGRGFW